MNIAGRAAAAHTLSAAMVFAAFGFGSAYAEPPQTTQAIPAPDTATPPAATSDPAATPPASSSTPPSTATAPSAEGQPAAPASDGAAPAAGTTPPAAEAQAPPPAPPADPVIAAVRERFADTGFAGKSPAGDRQGVTAFYQERSEGPLWVKSSGGFTPAAEAVIGEVRKADEWGMSAASFTLPQAGSDTSPKALAETEAAMALVVLQYARHARGGRIDPEGLSVAFDLQPPLKDPKIVLAEIAKTDAADAYLRGLQPKHEQFVRLKQALAKLRGPTAAEKPVEDEALSVKLPQGKNIKPGANDPDVSLLRRRLKVAAEAGNETVYDEPLQEAVKAFQRANGLKANGLLGKSTRAALNGESAPKADPDRDVQRVINNMERWRWMPEHLGSFYVWNNIPEFKTRTMKDGKQIYEERIVVGLPAWPTPAFSAQMRTIVFHPEWGVPDGIKQKELAPKLRRSSGGSNIFENLFGGGGGYSSSAVLRAYDLNAYYNGRPVDPDSVDWSSVDIRRFSFTQPSGPKNVLGIVKFLFPNKHDVYMHDTTQKELFQQNMRAYSHGCMRLQNPMKFAELLLQEDKGWSAGEVQNRLDGGGNEVKIDKTVWVHNTYFTAVVDDNGRLNTFADIYGFEPRVAAALSGKQIRFEAPPQVADAADDDGAPPTTQRRRKQRVTQSDSLTEAISGLFAN